MNANLAHWYWKVSLSFELVFLIEVNCLHLNDFRQEKRAHIFWRHNARNTTSKLGYWKCRLFFYYFLFLFFSASVLCFWIIRVRPTLDTTIKLYFQSIIINKHLINEILLYKFYRQYLYPNNVILHLRWCWDFKRMLLLHPILNLKTTLKGAIWEITF